MLGGRLKVKSTKKSGTVMLGSEGSDRSALFGGSLKLASGRSILDDNVEDETSPNDSHRTGLSAQKSQISA